MGYNRIKLSYVHQKKSVLIVLILLGLILIGIGIKIIPLIREARLISSLVENSNSVTDFLLKLDQYKINLESNNNADWLITLSQVFPYLKNNLLLKQEVSVLKNNWFIFQKALFVPQLFQEGNKSLVFLNNLKEALAFLGNYNSSFKEELTLLNNLLSLLGAEAPRHYLVIVQNTRIARPTGGLITNYLLLTADKGKITLEGHEINDLEDIFLQKIIPPLPLQTITNKWFFHDANWFFDFPTTARKLVDLYQTTGAQPSLDGVIALNDSALSQILEITGPIELSALNLRINAQNFTNTFSCTNTSRDMFPLFITGLNSALQTLPQEKLLALKEQILRLLNTKEIQLYTTDDALEYYFDSFGWTGKILESNGDYVAVVTNNLNKGCLLDQRQILATLSSELSTSSITDNLTITAKAETSKESSRETYLQIYLPKGITVLKASGGYLKPVKGDWPYEKLAYRTDSDLALREGMKVVDEINQIEIWEDTSKTVVATWTRLSRQPFFLSYNLPVLLKEETTNWNLVVQKQSGQQVNLAYELNLPPNITLSPTLFEFKNFCP